MSLTVFSLLLDVKNESAGRFEHAQKLFTAREKPFDVFIGRNAAVCVLSFVGIGRRRHDQVERVVRIFPQYIYAVAMLYFRCEGFHVSGLSLTLAQTQVVFQLCQRRRKTRTTADDHAARKAVWDQNACAQGAASQSRRLVFHEVEVRWFP